MTHKINRIPPNLPVGAYKTYQISSPLATHWTAATCAQVGCEHYLNGWALHVQAITPRDVHLARTSGRAFTERDMGPGQTWLVFEPGQPCFAAGTHVRQLERPELYTIWAGDWRLAPERREKVPVSSQAWVDDCGDNQQRLHDMIERHG